MPELRSKYIQTSSLSSRTAGKNAPQVLLPEQIVQSDGIGPKLDVGADQGRLLLMTLSIDQVSEKDGLIISVWGSTDLRDWGYKPLLSLPEKFYCGRYSALLNLAKYPAVRYLRVEWKMRHWGKGNSVPKFGFSAFTERSGARVSAAVAGDLELLAAHV